MSDADKIDHAVGCLQEIRRIVEKLGANEDAEVLGGYLRKIHQMAGYGLDNMQADKDAPPADPLVTPAVKAVMEKMNRGQFAAKGRGDGSADNATPAGGPVGAE